MALRDAFKPPSEWTTGSDPATGAMMSHGETLARELLGSYARDGREPDGHHQRASEVLEKIESAKADDTQRPPKGEMGKFITYARLRLGLDEPRGRSR